jgi:glycosyltransferase involved in cell wall biosynthesis
MHDNRLGILVHLPGLTRVIDVHGVVPEEFRFHNDFYSAMLFEKQERLAVTKSQSVVVVTEAMHRYLQQKYREKLRGKVINFPMFPDVTPCLTARPYVEGKPVFVYAGGLQKWQQIPQMIDAIVRTSHLFVYRVYCPDPDAVRAMLPKAVNESVLVACKSHEDLMGIYPQCHYGFILRKDIIINHVACPTKLVEYLAMGIVPVVDCEDIGDFMSLGMRFIKLQDLLAGEVPSETERKKMAAANFAIYEHLREVRHEGARAIYAALVGGVPSANVGRGMLSELKRAFPSGTLRGRLARQTWRTLKTQVHRSPQTGTGVISVEPTAFPQCVISREGCDVLVQVENFLAGGLENIALDLNEKLIAAGFNVILLVLGTPGAAVERAREKAMSVIVSSPERNSYNALLERIKPKLVLTHYSTFGAEDCVQRGIPFLQMIHNTYMWLDDRQVSEFSRTAKMTLSDYTKDYSIARLGIDEDRCVVIPPGIDYLSFQDLRNGDSRRHMRMIHGVADDDFVFLDIGAINHQKNHIATVRAFSSIAKECPKARLVILGPPYEPTLLDEIHRYVAEHGLNEVVTYAGSASDAHPYYAMADAFVTATFFEGGPLTLLEALAANLPVIMPNVGLAIYFRGRQGFEIVDPLFNISRYYGRMWEMASTPDFEHRMAAAMVRTYRTPQKPDLDVAMLDALDKRHAYNWCVQLIQDVLHGIDVRGKQFQNTWPNLLRKSSEDPNILVP